MRVSLGRATALLAILVAACSEGTGPNSTLTAGKISPVVASGQGTMTIAQGDAQFAQNGNTVSIDPAIQLLDNNGSPIANEPITFTPDQTTSRVGTGTPPFPNRSFIANTNSNGIAIVRWTLGTTNGGQTLTAQAGSGGLTAVFRAVATSDGSAPTIVKVQGDGAGQNSGQMRGNTARTNPTVLVQDGAATALPNVDVNFACTSGTGGTGCVTTPSTAKTASNGTAGTVWTFGTGTGAHRVTVTLSAGAPATQLQNVAAAVFSVTPLTQGTGISVVQGNNQTVVAGTGNKIGPRDPAVQITTSTGNVGAGIEGKWTFGAGTDDCNGNTTKTTATDANGILISAWCLTGSTTGTKTVTVTAGSFSQTFTATANAGAPATMTILQGNPCNQVVATTCTSDPTIQLQDAGGNNVSGISITFTASGNGVLNNGNQSGNTITVTTGSNGQAAARWTLGTTAGSQTLTAVASSGQSVTFNSTATAAASAAINKINGDATVTTAGNFTPRDPTVQVVDQYGNGKNGVLVNWSPDTGSSAFPSNINGGTTTPTSNTTGTGGTNVAGSAIARWQLNTVGTHTLTATVNGTSITTSFTGTAN